MAQFPLILAIEPRLLPAAVANGFRMDYKVGVKLEFAWPAAFPTWFHR